MGRPSNPVPEVYHQLAGMMVELIRDHGTNHANFIRAGRRIRQVIRKFHAALAGSGERPRAGPNLGIGLDKSQLQILGHGWRQGLAVPLAQPGLGVKQIELTRAPFHE